MRISQASLKTIHNQESADEARAKALRVMSKWRPLLPEACSVLEEGLEDTLTFCLPRSHRRHIRSDGPLERLFREAGRRTRASGVFPDFPLASCSLVPGSSGRRRGAGKRGATWT